MAGLLLICLTAAGFFGAAGQPMEIISHFRLHLAVSALALAVLCWPAGSRIATGLAALAALANLAVIAVDYARSIDGAPAPTGAREVRVLFANLLGEPDVLVKTAALAQTSGADVVALTELPPGGAAAVRVVLPGYGCITAPTGAQTAFTTVIAAKSCTGVGESQFSRPSDVVYLDHAGVRIVSLHPRPPVGPWATGERNAAIVEAVRLRASGPSLLIGDFNVTPYSSGLDPVGAAGFVRARCGAPFTTTWRDANPLLGLAIDLAFVSPDLQLTGCQVGPWIGSDHAPLIVSVAVAP